MQEVNADQDLIQAWEFSGGTGYSSHRPSLYGPPPAGHWELAVVQVAVGLAATKQNMSKTLAGL